MVIPALARPAVSRVPGPQPPAPGRRLRDVAPSARWAGRTASTAARRTADTRAPVRRELTVRPGRARREARAARGGRHGRDGVVRRCRPPGDASHAHAPVTGIARKYRLPGDPGLAPARTGAQRRDTRTGTAPPPRARTNRTPPVPPSGRPALLPRRVRGGCPVLPGGRTTTATTPRGVAGTADTSRPRTGCVRRAGHRGGRRAPIRHGDGTDLSRPPARSPGVPRRAPGPSPSPPDPPASGTAPAPGPRPPGP